MRTIDAIIEQYKHKLEALDIELLIAHILQKSREFVISHGEHRLSLWHSLQLRYLISKRIQDTPLAYLIGHKAFYGLEFFVNKHVLVPRPETELLVELAIKEIESIRQHEHITLIDVGTGSGCIPISILKHLPQKYENIQNVAVDVSQQALRVAQKNAQYHNVSINFYKGNLLFSFLENSALLTTSAHLLITANLPYLTQEEIDHEASIRQEPRLALYAADNGLALYKQLFQQITQLCEKQKLSFSVFCEINDHQAPELNAYAKKTFPKATIKQHKDFAGHIRIVSVRLLRV